MEISCRYVTLLRIYTFKLMHLFVLLLLCSFVGVISLPGFAREIFVANALQAFAVQIHQIIR